MGIQSNGNVNNLHTLMNLQLLCFDSSLKAADVFRAQSLNRTQALTCQKNTFLISSQLRLVDIGNVCFQTQIEVIIN